MLIFGQFRSHVDSNRGCLLKYTGPLVYGCDVELEGSVIVMRFPLFMRKCVKNENLLTFELRYNFLVFIFVFTSYYPIIDNSYNIHWE